MADPKPGDRCVCGVSYEHHALRDGRCPLLLNSTYRPAQSVASKESGRSHG